MPDKINTSSNRSFGLVFFIFFFIIGVYPLINDQEVRVWSLIISVFFLLLGSINSRILTPINNLWFKCWCKREQKKLFIFYLKTFYKITNKIFFFNYG